MYVYQAIEIKMGIGMAIMMVVHEAEESSNWQSLGFRNAIFGFCVGRGVTVGAHCFHTKWGSVLRDRLPAVEIAWKRWWSVHDRLYDIHQPLAGELHVWLLFETSRLSRQPLHSASQLLSRADGSSVSSVNLAIESSGKFCDSVWRNNVGP
jgi:hypothetical protein